ncbi:hypothetical protein [Paenibacillus alvei]|uniref:Uncharacterized protein n=1 Tax=Paenibacillus alvei TaxID=44250 RepID=A0AAP7DKN8_PAEAL|nr:hypothetical protein [Paenibacillus alvei]NOJ73180.1 hypothetical protein [Paenibacillus alvei]
MKNLMITIFWVVLLVSSCFFIFLGSYDVNVLRASFEKISSASFGIVISYSALVASVTALQIVKKNNIDQFKNELHDFIEFTVLYIVLNLVVYLISTLTPSNDVPLLIGAMIFLLLFMIFIISIRLLKLLKNLIY